MNTFQQMCGSVFAVLVLFVVVMKRVISDCKETHFSSCLTLFNKSYFNY